MQLCEPILCRVSRIHLGLYEQFVIRPTGSQWQLHTCGPSSPTSGNSCLHCKFREETFPVYCYTADLITYTAVQILQLVRVVHTKSFSISSQFNYSRAFSQIQLKLTSLQNYIHTCYTVLPFGTSLTFKIRPGHCAPTLPPTQQALPVVHCHQLFSLPPRPTCSPYPHEGAWHHVVGACWSSGWGQHAHGLQGELLVVSQVWSLEYGGGITFQYFADSL